MKTFGVCLSLMVGAVVMGCTSSESPVAEPAAQSPPQIDLMATLVEGSSISEADRASLMAAKDALFTRLSGRLMQAMGTGGPEGAIEICSKEARSLAEQVGQEQGVRIGRTGVRLRNSENVAPVWAEGLIEARTQEPVFGVLSDQRSVALLPIKLQAQCLACHGPSDRLSPGVQEQLAALYPDDQATGFQEGELRGWFWVESLR